MIPVVQVSRSTAEVGEVMMSTGPDVNLNTSNLAGLPLTCKVLQENRGANLNSDTHSPKKAITKSRIINNKLNEWILITWGPNDKAAPQANC